jgi:niacin transporter
MKQTSQKVLTMVIAALLCAVGILIPMFAPKIVLEPMSFTLASHVATFIAMFISPPVAVAVTLGTSAGFFFAGLPLVIVLRALSHFGFVALGCLILKKHPDVLQRPASTVMFSALLAVVHGICEAVVVTVFYFGGMLNSGYYSKGFAFSVLLMVGLGTIIHSMIDFGIALLVWRPLSRVIQIPVSAPIRSLEKPKTV